MVILYETQRQGLATEKQKGIVSYAFSLVDALLLLTVNVHQFGVPAVPGTVVNLHTFYPAHFGL